MRRAIGAVGRALVTIGILILLFVVYQLWGTGIYEARQQDELKAQFNATTTTTARTSATTAATVPAPPPPSGDAVAIMVIPKIGLDRAVVQGVAVPDLRRGPGHYPTSPLPGQIGNAAIAGHRTTYGAPFNRIDELAPGDPILVTTAVGTFRYKVRAQPDGSGHLIVKPTEVGVLNATPTATLTLTTCNPKFSASQRLVVQANLDVVRSPKPQKASPRIISAASSVGGLSGASESKLPTLWWGLAAAAVGLLWWLVFHRYRRWTTWFMGVIPFTLVLFFFYFHLERVLPSNY